MKNTFSTGMTAALPALLLMLGACATIQPKASSSTLTTGLNQQLQKRTPVKVFFLEDSVVSIVDFQWTDVSRGAGEHNVEWLWYKDEALVSRQRSDSCSIPAHTAHGLNDQPVP